MILGLPISTFFWIFIVPAVSVLLALVYGLTFRDTEHWGTLDDLFHKGKTDSSEQNNGGTGK